MQYNLADLHTHSSCSDGLRTPTQAVEEALAAGVRVLSLTDHDTVAGIDEAIAAGEKHGVSVVPGTELSAHVNERELHLLAYFVDHHSERLATHLVELRRRRHERGAAMVERLNGLGVPVTLEDVLERTAGGPLGRPHIAAAIVASGAAMNKEEAFVRFIGDRRPADVPKPRSPAAEVIGLVHELGGVAVLAHPGMVVSEPVIQKLVEVGLDGVEVYHPAHQPPQIEHYLDIAERYGLLTSGGSDSHGDAGGVGIGDYGIGVEAVEALSARAASYA
ncbi:MAG: PHP domain-containing protein [Gemmatimonadetes bacterium]|nr:PHP domain-containing protein [Gemmatimonadota bacterium]MBT6145252.1 PHP domain-containing protein [Gemmatimonadota bacterium]MBT7862387.1 PHP domain-containing protein [Gemmatimonadota bacterium]